MICKGIHGTYGMVASGGYDLPATTGDATAAILMLGDDYHLGVEVLTDCCSVIQDDIFGEVLVTGRNGDR